jgi:microcin C transport system substrate-binding protein
VRQIALGTYDNFNVVVEGVKGALAQGIDLNYDTLMVPALDEVSSEYGLLAEAVSYSSDFSSISFRLRSQAKWHDRTSVTTDDVIFSFDTFKKLSPQAAAEYQHILKAETTGDREVTFMFDGAGRHRVSVGRLPILPKAWWEGSDNAGRKRDIGSTTLEPPLGSGPYRIKEFSPGRSIIYERVRDYWGANINVNVGRNNFDELRFEYFRDGTAALEAFKADAADWRIENSAKNWATAYDFPAVVDKRVILEEFPINNIGSMQAFALNIRRQKFQDSRVRRAINCAFDFEKMNEQIFFGQYKRIASYFEGTEFAATGLPSEHELLLLESIRDKIPLEVFLEAYSNPVNGSPEAVRANLREAMRLLKEAGYEVRNQDLVDSKTGEPFRLNF